MSPSVLSGQQALEPLLKLKAVVVRLRKVSLEELRSPVGDERLHGRSHLGANRCQVHRLMFLAVPRLALAPLLGGWR